MAVMPVFGGRSHAEQDTGGSPADEPGEPDAPDEPRGRGTWCPSRLARRRRTLLGVDVAALLPAA
jgi:hypothetical protein